MLLASQKRSVFISHVPAKPKFPEPRSYTRTTHTHDKRQTTKKKKKKIITLGKRGTHPAWQKASSFLLQPSLTPKVFETLATRYAHRPGGYTRIHKYGRRQGDNAPHAVLELVDGPKDLKFEMAARATGWDVLSGRLKTRSARSLVKEGVVVDSIEETVEREQTLGGGGGGGGGEESELRERTRWNLRKALRYRPAEDVKRFGEKVQEHMVRPPHPHLSPHRHSTFAPTLRPPLVLTLLPFLGHSPCAAAGCKSPPGALRKRVRRIGSAILPQHQRLQVEGRGDRARCCGQCIAEGTG
jgi:ribosomal protein L17